MEHLRDPAISRCVHDKYVFKQDFDRQTLLERLLVNGGKLVELSHFNQKGCLILVYNTCMYFRKANIFRWIVKTKQCRLQDQAMKSYVKGQQNNNCNHFIY